MAELDRDAELRVGGDDEVYQTLSIYDAVPWYELCKMEEETMQEISSIFDIEEKEGP